MSEGSAAGIGASEMSQRWSEYARIVGDRYLTPEWVTLALIPHLPRTPTRILEPAAGAGDMAGVLRTVAEVVACDIADGGEDFLAAATALDCDAVITNPPYKLATEFIERALAATEYAAGMVAMLLRVDFDSAKCRRHLFADCPAFAKKVVLTQRIRWFADSTGSPSFNHAWYLWCWRHQGPATIGYAP
jgi:hypothetical protein